MNDREAYIFFLTHTCSIVIRWCRSQQVESILISKNLLLWLFDFLTPHFFVKVTSSFQLRHFSRVSFIAESPSWPGESAGGLVLRKTSHCRFPSCLWLVRRRYDPIHWEHWELSHEIQIKLASIKEQRLFNTAETVSVLVDKTWRKKKIIWVNPNLSRPEFWCGTHMAKTCKNTCCYEFCQCKF